MDISKLKGKLPDGIYDQIPAVLVFGIDGPKRMSHLLGQCRHETGDWKKFTENLNYSAQGLANTWPNRYAVDPKAQVKIPNELAKKLQRDPVAIANNCYANRNGNGDEASGDGYKFRGRGAIQLTGKANYKALGDFLKIDLVTNPDLVATDYQLACAAFYFKNVGLWTICDKGIDIATVTIVTRKVNGGSLGLHERLDYTQGYYTVLTS